MTRSRSRLLTHLARAMWLMLLTSACTAETFPTQPVRIVAATPPGGAADVNARRLADKLSRMWKQPVVVQNLSGGAGNVAASAVA